MTTVGQPGYPSPAGWVNRVEPAPRRVRGVLAGRAVLDTSAARYVWEIPMYPQYYVPVGDVDANALVDEDESEVTDQGPVHWFGLRVGEAVRPHSVRVFGRDAVDGVVDTARVEFDALDQWFEEDEPIFVHPRSPYVRVDAVRSQRRVQVSLDGVRLADCAAPVMLFETGLPTRYYLDRTDVAFEHLVASNTQTACPYKGLTSGYWSVRGADGQVADAHRDLAWTYSYPTRDVLPITGLVAFYNEKVDITIDGEPEARPQTRFS